MEYVRVDFDSLYNEAMDIYQQNGGDILFPGDEKEILMRSVLAVLVQERAGVNVAIALGTVRGAVGEYLDDIGEHRGVRRQQQTTAQATLRVTVRRAPGGVTIRQGTQFAVNGMLVFETTQAAGTTEGEGTAELVIPVSCLTGGSAGNGISAGTALTPIEPRAEILSCVMASVSAGGLDREEDDAYRERIISSTFQKNATGSRAQYRASAMAVSAAILDASPVADEQFADGIGTKYGLLPGQVLVSLLFSDSLSQQDRETIIQAAWMALNSDESRPLTDTVLVREAAVVPFHLVVRYKLKSSETGENLIASVLSAAQEYKQWQCARIGRAFDPYRLTSMLYSAGCSRVSIVTGASQVGGAAAEYMEIDGATRLEGTVTLEEMEE